VSLCDVLVIDDDAEIRETLVEVLEERGIHAEAAQHGAQALDRLRHGLHPSLILLDLMMPVMDGATFRAEQRRDAAIADIPVVVISASQDLDGTGEAMAAAATLQKPISFRDLIDTVKRLCP
jgi:CheY-like chemotaxis protein